MLLNLSQYEQVLMDAGYDDIDFVSDITTEELQDIGITKKGTTLHHIHTHHDTSQNTCMYMYDTWARMTMIHNSYLPW